MKQAAKKILKRMIKCDGFISDGIYDEMPRLWYSNSRCSNSLMNVLLLDYLHRNGYIIRDKKDRFLVSAKGRHFATPWYKRILV